MAKKDKPLFALDSPEVQALVQRAYQDATAAVVATHRARASLRKLDPSSPDPFRRPYTAGPYAYVTHARLAADMKAVTGSNIAPPVFPNEGVTEWYYRQLHSLPFEMQAEILGALDDIWGNTSNLIVGDAKRGTRAQQLEREMNRWSNRWTLKLEKLSLRLSTKFADKSFQATNASLQQSFKKAGLTVRFKPTRGSVEAYRAVVAENVNLIKSIPAQYAKDVQTAVWDSVMKGGDLDTLTKEVKAKYGVADRRAKLIARDQNAKAKAVLERVRRQELGITEAIWMHSSAGKEPRPTHVAMNGKRYKLSEGMYDSDEGEWIEPGELINCRCTSRAVIPGLDDDDQ